MTDTAIELTTNAHSSIERAVLSITPAMKAEDVLAIYDRLCFYIKTLTEIKRERCEPLVIEWIKANGDLDNGNGLRWYVGSKKVTKVKDQPKTIEALMDAVKGDLARFSNAFGANSIKPGAAKEIFTPEQFEEHFTVEYQDELKDGKPVKKLQKLDERFVK